MEKDIINDVLAEAAKRYSESKATTNAGVVLRTVARIIPVSIIIKLFAHKVSK